LHPLHVKNHLPLFYLNLTPLLYTLSMKKQIQTIIIFIIFIFFCFVIRFYNLNKYSHPIIVFFNTSEGESILIRNSEFCSILIDAGIDYELTDNIYKFLPFYKKNIDYVFLSHPHKDHYQGFFSLTNKYTISNFFYSHYFENHEIINQLKSFSLDSRSIMEEKNIHACGFTIKAYTLNKSVKKDDINTQSLILEVYYDSHWILLSAGDIYIDQELELLNKLPQKQALYIYKSSHHGSKTSNSEILLSYLKPKISVITSGFKNRFHHPHLESLNTIKKHSNVIYRTDIQNPIIIPVSN